MMIKQLYKRKTTAFLSAIILGVFSFSLPGCAQEASDTEAASEALPDFPFLDHDMVLGDENAPVELIEYASLTCNHCATFHNTVLPRIKEKYVDTGKVKIIFRSFILNGIDMSASTLTRCVPEKRYFAFMNALFKRQSQWYNVGTYKQLNAEFGAAEAGKRFTDATMEEVSKYARQAGLNKNKINACVFNPKIREYLFSVHQEGVDKYKVNATPTILVNGNKANNDYASVERAIEEALD